MNTEVECKICNKMFKRVTVKHLRTHGVTIDEYQSNYPHDSLISESTRRKLATNSLDRFIEKHGTTGAEKYQTYRTFQSVKNSLSYKKEKYGWTNDEFDAYNKKRAVTLQNLIKKHGEEDGQRLYITYCNKQKESGVSLKYFQAKYGEIDGKAFFDGLNKRKAHTLETYTKRYGSEIIAKEKLEHFFSKLSGNSDGRTAYSNIQLEFIQNVTSVIGNTKFYSCLTSEFGIWVHSMNKYCKYDLVFPTKKLAVEFNGDYWHCNPEIYSPNFIHPIIKLKAFEVWERDKLKISALESVGYEVKVIWERDYNMDKALTVKTFQHWIENAQIC